MTADIDRATAQADGELMSMRRTARTVLLSIALIAAITACGSSDGEQSPGTTLPAPGATTPTTITPAVPATPVTTAAGGRAAGCAALANQAVKLFESWRRDMTGVAGPSQESQHRAEAQALAAEARRLGCPVPDRIEEFITG